MNGLFFLVKSGRPFGLGGQEWTAVRPGWTRVDGRSAWVDKSGRPFGLGDKSGRPFGLEGQEWTAVRPEWTRVDGYEWTARSGRLGVDS